MSACIECNDTFEINEGEKDFFVQRDLVLPKRCKPCRVSRKQQTNGNTIVSNESDPILSKIYCDNCGKEANVPFKPEPNRRAYCRVCWNGIKNVGIAAEFV